MLTTVRPVARHVGVVVPAHDEQESLPACLAALRVAARVARVAAGVTVELLVVLDDCRDATAGMAARAGVRTVETAARNVGVARAAGMAAVLARAPAPGTTWLATTDADSAVGPGWIAGQLALAGAGADLVVGTVEVRDWSAWPPGVAIAHAAGYGVRESTDLRDGRGSAGAEHPHVHGANLGIAALAYGRLGGFAPLAVGEDHRLVDQAVAAGMRVARTRHLPVATSARRHARAPHGFSSHLAALAEDAACNR